ncbi:hypothetical protein BaRGS_00023720 [Batillaria attramentaria]|uniref:Leishmanolysin-like peptidase n=1 Tax=Batillaria attramentaria TaxID=370345 RepID=A0ABD0KD56_9CAEN
MTVLVVWCGACGVGVVSQWYDVGGVMVVCGIAWYCVSGVMCDVDTESEEDDSDLGLIIGLSVSIPVVLLVGGVIAVCLYLHKRPNQKTLPLVHDEVYSASPVPHNLYDDAKHGAGPSETHLRAPSPVSASPVPSLDSIFAVMEAQPVFYDVDIEPAHVIKRRSVNQPLRIHLHFDDSVDALPLRHRDLIRTEVKKAVRFWEETLMVRPTQAPIRLRRQCLKARVEYFNQRAYCDGLCAPTTVCGEITIPPEHLESCYRYDKVQNGPVIDRDAGPGVNETDFILYIATKYSQRCQQGRTVAYAAHCQQERVPVAGYFSVCPQSIAESWQERQQLLSTMKHEILHALGFTAGLYAFYRDAAGNPLTERSIVTGKPLAFDGMKAMYRWSDRVVKNFTRDDWLLRSGTSTKVVSLIVTPKVREEVRQHFNCPTLEGAELEDQGIDGTAITHWEKRVFENEAMTGTYTQNSVISRITLALMEDTGWYKANYSNAGDYEWGKGLGCEFVKKSCYHWISTRLARNKSIYPYCQRVKRGELWTDCTHNRHAVALCNLVEYTTHLPLRYQYFDRGQLRGVHSGEESRYGGSVVLADYCPYLQEFSWTSQKKIIRGSSCTRSSNGLSESSNYFGETYGNQSRCFNHGGEWVLYECNRATTPQHSGSGCYEFSCSNERGLVVNVGGRSYDCSQKGFIHKVMFLSSGYRHSGTFVCPACQEICQDLGYTCPPERRPRQLPQERLPTPCRATQSANLLTSLICVCAILSMNFSSPQSHWLRGS